MDFTIFYAWQSDTVAKFNRFFIRDALERAIKAVSNDGVIEDSPRLDHDTKGLSGTPEIAGSIFRKIETCGIFIADVTLVGASKFLDSKGDAKQYPNSNVALELGYAAAKIGWDRIICVMNDHFGKPEEQIFDIKHRRFPICYTLDPLNQASIADKKENLKDHLEEAVVGAANSQYDLVQEVVGSLDLRAMELLQRHAAHDVFYTTKPSKMGEVLANQWIDLAVSRLLSLRVIRCALEPSTGIYKYFWTYLGKQILSKLGLRAAGALVPPNQM